MVVLLVGGRDRGFFVALEPVGPWRVKLDPYPFAESPGSFSLIRRVIAKNGSVDVLAAPPQETAITIDAA